jgi:hypothetical protein
MSVSELPAPATGTSTQATVVSASQRWRWWLAVIGVGLLAFAVRYYYITHAMVFQPIYMSNANGDSVEYYDYAINLVRRSVFSVTSMRESVPIPDNFRDPGYPLFLAALMKVSASWNTWYANVLTCQALMSALTVMLWMSIGRRWMPLPWLVAAGILMAWWPHSVSMTSMIMSETLFGFLCALSLWVFQILIGTQKPHWAIISGILFALAALTNAIMLPFSIVLSAGMWFRHQLSGRVAIILVAVSFLVIAPWWIRNTTLPSHHLTSSYRAHMNLVQGSWPTYHQADRAWATKQDPAAARELDQINSEIHTLYTNHLVGAAIIWHRLAAAPWAYIRWYLYKPALLWGWSMEVGQGTIYFNVTTNSPYEVNPPWRTVSAICYGLNPILLIFAAIGCVLGILSRRPPPTVASISLLALFVTLVYVILQSEPRYSIPFRGAEILLSFYAAYWLCQEFFLWRSSRKTLS